MFRYLKQVIDFVASCIYNTWKVHIEKISFFDWDEGNSLKNPSKHGISNEDMEEAFFDHRKKTLNDVIHSGEEERYIILGQTKKGKTLFIVYTKRGQKIRIISSRGANKKERLLYEKANTTTRI